MSLLRLRERVPSAEIIGTYTLNEHALRFHKVSDDGSGKCDAYQTYDLSDLVIGVLFDINEKEKSALDNAEGLGHGYLAKTVTITSTTGDVDRAFTYYAIQINPSLKPYSWYLNHVLVGAKQAKLPAPYLNVIEATKSIEDKNSVRDAQQRSIYR